MPERRTLDEVAAPLDCATLGLKGRMGVDPSRGTVSYVSPLARAVLTYGPGDTVEIAGGKAVILDLR